MEDDGHRHLPLGWRDFLDTPITEEELKAALSKGPCNNAPGRYGICVEFFKVNLYSIKSWHVDHIQPDILEWSDNGRTVSWHRVVHI